MPPIWSLVKVGSPICTNLRTACALGSVMLGNGSRPASVQATVLTRLNGAVFSNVFGEDAATPMIISEVMLVLELRKQDEESGGTDVSPRFRRPGFACVLRARPASQLSNALQVGDGEGISETFQKTLQYVNLRASTRSLVHVT